MKQSNITDNQYMPYSKLNHSFGRRIGKKLSHAKRDILQNVLPQYSYSNERISNRKYEKIFMEVGFGMGEHFIHQVRTNPQNMYLGVEVYLNGVANVLLELEESKNENFLIWPDNVDLILGDMPDRILDGIYILFPDPWPKRRYIKKRLFNQDRLDIFKHKLSDKSAFIHFGSDIKDYFDSTTLLLSQDDQFKISELDGFAPHENYIQTKYHKKSVIENRNAEFVTATIESDDLSQ